ncbi:MAG: alpha-methylacyl-CoA racemase [Pseudonocardiales bacterium]|nr:alpha-methylacyl-CoA racemase [Pseudonocardiales bacterium]
MSSEAVDGAASAALNGVRVVYLSALGPVPFAAMLLADLGADVIRIDRASGPIDVTGLDLAADPRTRGQRAIGLDLKRDDGVALARRLTERADVFVEGMRPGVAERMGLGPEPLRASNPRLVYARMTGWGQSGPLANTVGHDINYLAAAGGLHPIGPSDRPPVVPLNLLADFGGGGAYLVMGILAALLQRASSGRGQLIDCAMVDGVASLTTMFHGLLAGGTWTDTREANLLDGAAPYYRTYVTSDDRYVAVGALEAKFYAELMDGLGLDAAEWPQQDRSLWPRQRDVMAEVFRGDTREHWVSVFADREACVTPVNTFGEAAGSAHLRARSTFVEWGGLVQPAPAPRLSDSPPTARPRSGWSSHTDEILRELGTDTDSISRLRNQGTVS